MRSTKLITNLNDKYYYVTHYKCLKFYLSQGMQLTKIHRILSFSQSAFMRPFIEYCNSQRQNAKTDFESGLYKLLPNTFFGKSCENLRKRVNIRFVTDPKKTDQSRRQKHLQKIYDRELGLGFGRNRQHQNLHESPHRPGILYFRDGKIGDVSILLRSAIAQIRRQISYAFHGHWQFHLFSRNAGLACRYGWHDAMARYL